MNGEGRIPPLLILGLVFLVLVIGALAYYAGRFGRDGPAEDPKVELPPPGRPDPAIAQVLPTPAEVPPTVTPSAAVMIERETRTSRTSRSSAPLVERSSQIEVKVPAVVPTARMGVVPTFVPTPRRPIVVQIVTPALVPTPRAIEPERDQEEDEESEDEEPPVVTPQPEPTVRPR